jgi:hypothetical protein
LERIFDMTFGSRSPFLQACNSSSVKSMKDYEDWIRDEQTSEALDTILAEGRGPVLAEIANHVAHTKLPLRPHVAAYLAKAVGGRFKSEGGHPKSISSVQNRRIARITFDWLVAGGMKKSEARSRIADELGIGAATLRSKWGV